MFDPISDMLIRIKNAQRAGREEVVMPFSGLKIAIAQILEKEGFVKMFQKEKEGNKENIKIVLKYVKSVGRLKIPSITDVKRISKPGRRIYVGKNEIRKVRSGYGLAIVSTSKGVMTGREARKMGLGGEYICEIW